MKKKIIIAIVVVVVLISSVAIYFTTKSDFVINIAKPVDLSTQKYSEQIILSWGKAPSEKEEEYLTEFSKQIEATQLEIATEYIAPTHIEVEVEFEGGKTIVTYSGKATEKDSNTEIDYNKELVFDFILTKEVNEN
jgi:hypothetical protein